MANVGRHLARNFTTSCVRHQTNMSSLEKFTQVIHKNMTLKHCSSVVPFFGRWGSAMASAKGQETAPTHFVPDSKRPLAIILSWLAAQEKHIDKYRSIWIERGFDVLTVKMTPYQFLLPTMGSHVLVQDLIRFLYALSTHYPEYVLHCFSVGAYEFGEILAHLNDEKFISSIKLQADHDPKEIILRSIKGVVMDSAVSFEGIASGVATSISANPVVNKSLESYIRTHLKLMHPVATKYYKAAANQAYSSPLTQAPALLMYSNRDKIGSRAGNEYLRDCWKSNGIKVSTKLFDKSAHVQHHSKYPQEYINEIDNFLGQVSLTTLK
ncbi:Transmembrane protein 53 [Halotydeus destructor]|nr:Transmembrane protein 53 [Halotydeus destructor]